MSMHSNHKTGFTIVEMLVVAPLAILLVGGLIAAIVSLTSKVMMTQARNDLAYSSNKALNQIEVDVNSSLDFMSDSGNIASPQGSGDNFNGAGKFLSSSALILETLATDKNPLDPDKKIIYYANKPAPCGNYEQFNTPLTNKVIYFLNTSNSNLYRRTIVPLPVDDFSSVCEKPWQVNTCVNRYNGNLFGQICSAKDDLMATSVKSFSVKYYLDPSDTTETTAANAKKSSAMEATIVTERQVAGEAVSATYSIRSSLYKK